MVKYKEKTEYHVAMKAGLIWATTNICSTWEDAERAEKNLRNMFPEVKQTIRIKKVVIATVIVDREIYCG